VNVDFFSLGTVEFVEVRDDLFSLALVGETPLWRARLEVNDYQVLMRAWRKVSSRGEVFLDQELYLVGDDSAHPRKEIDLAMAKFVQELDRKALSAAARVAATDVEMAKEYPALMEYLTLLTIGKEPRQPSRLSLFSEDGVFKVFLNDPHTARYACVSGKTVKGVLRALEEVLANGEVDWRPQQSQRKK
jgi:hypothetical protein